MHAKLTIPEIIQNGVAIGVPNMVPIVVNGILSVFTFLIPYLNGGMLIAWMTMPIKLARGESIELTEIWKDEHRENMGQVLYASGLMAAALLGSYFLLGMGVVLYYGWFVAMQLVIGKGLSGPEALAKSWELTRGLKLTIWLAQLVFFIAFMIAAAILQSIGGLHSILGYLTTLMIFGMLLALLPVFTGMRAFVYKRLTE